MAILLLLVLGGAAAGAFGALLGLGGGVLIVPLLTLGFGLDFRDAVAISLLAVVTTSSASAAVYLERRVADLRLGMRLELATAVGGVVGALVAFALEERMLAAIFALMLTLTALSMVRRAISDRRAQSATA
ncbi:MAG: sulfite exporter TauE/SafE family protein, partial [Chloroflexi bacterium]|nr:sulfite exporter TauE/SafE family protein [Chloroflexota bacterium]